MPSLLSNGVASDCTSVQGETLSQVDSEEDPPPPSVHPWPPHTYKEWLDLLEKVN